VALPTVGKQRPSFRWSDIWKAPLHDFPIRDEILYQYLPLSPDMDVLEIGPGSGFTAFRLARQVRRMTLVDVAAEPLTELRRQLRHLPNVNFASADLSRPGLSEQLKQDFDAAFGLDVLEYVADPAACLRNLASVLRLGGESLLSYPNVPPPAGDGVTYFSKLSDLERVVAQAGFRNWQIFAVQLRPFIAEIYRALHEWPLQFYRARRNSSQDGKPQTYDATWTFQRRKRLLRYKVPLHLLWAVLEKALRVPGDLFEAEAVTEEILGRQLVIRACR
jgi:2-polyprenyl-3-methyl-5-hydroxy-6-metoxy-1,4-benzoquinol methylase